MTAVQTPVDAAVDAVRVAVYRFPTPEPEADGTLTWSATTAVVVTVHADGVSGLGWTYSSPAAADVIEAHFTELLAGRRVHDTVAHSVAMRRATRNVGAAGLVGQALSAVDIALWDLKAKLLGCPLTTLLGACREKVPVYGSGGFLTSSDAELSMDVAAWQGAGCRAMKIKIGGDPERDLQRVLLLRESTSPGTDLMVDANGAYGTGEAVRIGAQLDELGVCWFEEPVSSDDTDGLAVVRSALRSDVTAGEYVDTEYDAMRLARVVDCLQVDATRCGGYTGFMRIAAIAAAHNLDVSAHCAPALHAPIAAAVPRLRHVEWFLDHVRLEPLLIQGAPIVTDGAMVVQRERGGHGMELTEDAERFLFRGDERGRMS